MTYFPLIKKPVSFRIATSLVMLIGFGFFALMINGFLTSIIEKFIVVDEGVGAIINVFCAALWLGLWGYDTFSKKGVFVYYDRIIIRNGVLPIRFRKIKMVNILSAQYCFNFNQDKDYYHSRFGGNLIEGESNCPCVKLYTTNHGVRFVGVEDSGALVTELQHCLENVKYPD